MLLGGVFELHEPTCEGRCRSGCVRDTEALCASVLERRGIRRDHPDFEDRLAELIADAWKLHREYDPAKDRARSKGREPDMASFIAFRLGHRIVDFERSRYRTKWVTKHYVYERPRIELVPLDERGLERIERKGTGDPARDSDPDLARIYAGGDRQRALDIHELGERPPKRVT